MERSTFLRRLQMVRRTQHAPYGWIRGLEDRDLLSSTRVALHARGCMKRARSDPDPQYTETNSLVKTVLISIQ